MATLCTPISCAHIVIYLFMCQVYVYEYLRLLCFRESTLTPPCDIVITVLNARSRGSDAPLDLSTIVVSLLSLLLPGQCSPLSALHETDQLEVRPLTKIIKRSFFFKTIVSFPILRCHFHNETIILKKMKTLTSLIIV